MIRLPNCNTVLQAAWIAVAVSVLCGSGRAQSTPSVSIAYPTNGLAINSAYISVQVAISGASSVTSPTLRVTDNTGSYHDLALYGSGSSYGITWSPTGLIPSGSTSYNGPVTFQARATCSTPG